MHLELRANLDEVADLDVLEDAEKAIAVTGNTDIAALVGRSHSGDESGAAIEAELVVVVEHRDFESQRWHREHGDRHTLRELRLFVVAHATRRPLTLVRRTQPGGEVLERARAAESAVG